MEALHESSSGVLSAGGDTEEYESQHASIEKLEALSTSLTVASPPPHTNNNSVEKSPSLHQDHHHNGMNRIRLEFNAGGGPPFCGRRSELEDLVHVFGKVQRTKRAASVLVKGGAGCGKSRLIQAFRDRIMIPLKTSGETTTTTKPTSIIKNSNGHHPHWSNNTHTHNDTTTTSPPKPNLSFEEEKKSVGWTNSNEREPETTNQQQQQHKLPPIFCTAKFDEGQAASSEALGPLLQCFAAITETLLATEESREYWKPILSQALENDLMVLVPLLPSLKELEQVSPPPIPRPMRFANVPATATNMASVDSNPPQTHATLARAQTTGGRPRSDRRITPPLVAQSQPASASNPLALGITTNDHSRLTKSHPPSVLSRIVSSGRGQYAGEASPSPTLGGRFKRSHTIGDTPTNHNRARTQSESEHNDSVSPPLPPPQEGGISSSGSNSKNPFVVAFAMSKWRRQNQQKKVRKPKDSINSVAVQVDDTSTVHQLHKVESPTLPELTRPDSLIDSSERSDTYFDSQTAEPATTSRSLFFLPKGEEDLAMTSGATTVGPLGLPSPYHSSSPQGTNLVQDMSMRAALIRTKSAAPGFGAFSQRNLRHRPNHHHHPILKHGNTNKHIIQTNSLDEDSVADDLMRSRHRSMGTATSNNNNTTTTGKLDHEDYSVERIQFALRAYLRCVCKWRTVVFFLDDLQWAGREAVAVFRTFLMDVGSFPRRFLFLGAHRPFPRGHEMLKLIYDLEEAALKQVKAGIVQTTISKPEHVEVDSLRHDDVVELVSKLLKREKHDVGPFANLVLHKTAGNCFFVIEFVRMLENKGMIRYSIPNTRWEWADLTDISARMEISDNVVDVVASTICEAPLDIKVALLTAAAFGSGIFSAQTLFRAIPSERVLKETLVRRASNEVQLNFVQATTSMESLICSLEEATESRYLESLGSLQYKFAHDRIREATVSLLPKGVDMVKMRLQIGRQLRAWLLEQLVDDICDEKLLLQVVIQLNQASHLMHSREEKVELSKLNFTAAKNAIQRSSFFPASDFLRAGIDLLGENPWVEHYDDMIKLSDTLMRMDYCCGRLVVSVELANEILQHASSFDDKKMAYHIKVLWLTQNERIDEALDFILSVLNELGAPVPRRFLRVHRILDWIRMARMMRGLSDEKLLSLPNATADHIDDIGSFMERLEEVSLNGINPQPDLLNVALLRVMQLTVKHGRFSMTPTCLVSWGWYHARAGRLDAAHRFGELGVRLAKEQTGGYHDARAILMYYMHIYHWRNPYHDGIKPTTEALQKLWDLGAIEYVFLDTITYLRIYFCCGLRLEPLAMDIRKYVDLLKDYGHRLAFENHVAFFQCVEALIGGHDKGSENGLLGEVMEQEDYMTEWEERKYDAALQQAFFQRMMQAYFFGDIDMARQMSKNMWSPFEEGPDVLLPFRVFFLGMTALSSYILTKKRSHRRKGKKMIKIMERWDSHGVVNVHHMLFLLKAEYNAGTSMDFTKVRRSFDEAISIAARCGFLHFQALGNERAGVYCRKQDENDWGQLYILQARELYTDWGAMAKVRKMQDAYGYYLEGSDMPRDRGSTIYSKARLGDLSREIFKDLRTEDEDL